MRRRRIRVSGRDAVYHCMTRTVNGEILFGDREKEVLRKMLWRIADFSGVEILTYALMGNHFHVLVRVPSEGVPGDGELVRRYGVLYPEPTRFQPDSVKQVEATLKNGGAEAEALRRRLSIRMGDVSEFMKTLKQRFSVWYNRTHDRYGTLWSERFKSVLVEGAGNPLQTMAAYIDLNPVRAGLCEDPKDYRFCGYAEGVAGNARARYGLRQVWGEYVGQVTDEAKAYIEALRAHRELIFAKGANDESIVRERAVRVLEKERGMLPKAVVLRCRVRYFTDGAILGSAEFVRQFSTALQLERGRKREPRPRGLRGADWGDLAVIQGLRRTVFG